MLGLGAVLLVLALVMGLGGLGPEGLLLTGGVAVSFGLLCSLVVGVVYHWRLRAAMKAAGPLPPRWWWAPSRLHDGLSAQGRAAVLPVFRAGVILIAFACGGLVFIAAGAVKALILGR